MSKLTKEIEIDATADRIWEVLSDYGNVYKWAPIVAASRVLTASSTGLGAERACTIPGFGEVVETVTEWEDGSSLSYRVTGVPGVTDQQNRFSVTPEGDGSVVVLEVDLEMVAPEAQRAPAELQFAAVMEVTLAGLRQYVETGESIGSPAAA